MSGCPYDEPEDPGNLEFDWLEAKLARYRERGMQVWMIGTDWISFLRARELKSTARTRSSIPGQLFPGMRRSACALHDKSLIVESMFVMSTCLSGSRIPSLATCMA